MKTWLYAAVSVLLGSWAAPLLYNAGKALAEVSQSKDTNGPIEWLARICERADFPKFFVASLLIAAGILFLPFTDWLRSGHAGDLRKSWSQRSLREGADNRLIKKSRQCFQGVCGFLIVTLLFLLFASLLIWSGVLEWKNPGGSISSFVRRGFTTALGLAVLQEILFRGIAMGIFLRAMRPMAAIAMTGVLFSLVHFLNPSPGVNVVDPDASGVGFELLRGIGASFFQPHVFFGVFIPLLALGGVLAYARWSTGSPGLSIGLHTGWIFIHSLIGDFTVARENPAFWGLSDTSLGQGIIPLAGILFIGFLIHMFTTTRDVTDAPT